MSCPISDNDEVAIGDPVSSFKPNVCRDPPRFPVVQYMEESSNWVDGCGFAAIPLLCAVDETRNNRTERQRKYLFCDQGKAVVALGRTQCGWLVMLFYINILSVLLFPRRSWIWACQGWLILTVEKQPTFGLAERSRLSNWISGPYKQIDLFSNWLNWSRDFFFNHFGVTLGNGIFLRSQEV